MSYKSKLSRRNVLGLLTGVAAVALLPTINKRVFAQDEANTLKNNPNNSDKNIASYALTDEQWAALTPKQWKERLTKEQYRVLREAGTERSGTSPLNEEKRKGIFACAGCRLPLFKSNAKYDSGTGWPSFYDVIEGTIGTSTDYKALYPRTEYHCRRCGGHQGHIFPDGPEPTGKRYCNNGVALTFIADDATPT